MVLAQTLDAEGEATALATAHRVITLRFFGSRTGGRLPTARTPLQIQRSGIAGTATSCGRNFMVDNRSATVYGAGPRRKEHATAAGGEQVPADAFRGTVPGRSHR